MISSRRFRASVNCVVACCFMTNVVNGETYSSVMELKKLIRTQESVIEALDSYIAQEMGRLSNLAGYLDIFKIEHNKAVANPQKYIGNPMNCFLLIKRLTTDLHFIVELSYRQSKLETDSNVTYPTKEDLIGAAGNVARLQQTYLLDVQELAAGKLKESHFTPMSANDCYELGRILYEVGYYHAGKDWLLEAYKRVDPTEITQQPMLAANIIEALCFAYISLGDMENAKKWTRQLEELGLYDEIISVKALLEKKRLWDIEVESKQNLQNSSEALMRYRNNYGRVCRGEMDLTPEIKHRLKCRYLMNNPFLKLAPLKMEQLYINPDIYLFYDVMSDSEIEEIKTLGYPKLVRSKVRTEEEKVTKQRISLNSWINRADSLTINSIYSRIGDMTGLSTRWSEALQLALYPSGGHYEAHYDTFVNDTYGGGYRIATVMFYLSEVEEGGATVFVNLGLTVFPVKNAALFWYNTHSSGKTHINTLHAACPVLLGYKWAANVWMRSYGQEFLQPCKVGGDQTDI